MFMWSPCILHRSERPKFSDLRLNTVKQIMVTSVGGVPLRVCGSARFVALAQVTPQASQLFSSRRSVIAEVSNKLHPSLAGNTERVLGWEWVFGQGKGKTETGRNAPESKATPVPYSAQCLSTEKEDRAHVVRAKKGKRVLGIQQ